MSQVPSCEMPEGQHQLAPVPPKFFRFYTWMDGPEVPWLSNHRTNLSLPPQQSLGHFAEVLENGIPYEHFGTACSVLTWAGWPRLQP